MIKLGELFDVKYGVNLEFNKMKPDPNGINFVSRTARNNGVSAKVARLPDVTPTPAGVLTVAGGGSVMETFLQPEPFYSGRDLYYLIPKVEMSVDQKLYYCACIRANKFRFNYGRQANRTLRDIRIPSLADIPKWVSKANPDMFDGADSPATKNAMPEIDIAKWKPFAIQKLFELKKGMRLTKVDMTSGDTPFIGAIDSNNGVSAYVGQVASHPAGTMTVNYNGNGVAEAFYQPLPFRCSDDVNVLYPKFELTPAIALFIGTIIRQEKYRFNYGRKWHLDRMKESVISLPATPDGKPDWKFMESYIKALPFSSQIEK